MPEAQARWQKDMAFMQERAKALGADIELPLDLPDSSKTQAEDCLEMLSDGIEDRFRSSRRTTPARSTMS